MAFSELGKKLSHLLTVGDGKTYEILCKLKREYTKELEWVIQFPGDWHMIKHTQPVLFKVYIDAGLRLIAETTFNPLGTEDFIFFFLLNQSFICYSNQFSLFTIFQEHMSL